MKKKRDKLGIEPKSCKVLFGLSCNRNLSLAHKKELEGYDINITASSPSATYLSFCGNPSRLYWAPVSH